MSVSTERARQCANNLRDEFHGSLRLGGSQKGIILQDLLCFVEQTAAGHSPLNDGVPMGGAVAKWINHTIQELSGPDACGFRGGDADRRMLLKVLHAVRDNAHLLDNNAPAKSSPEVFYMVFADGGRGPVMKHTSYVTAEQEAERIARAQGCTTYVLRADEKIVPTTTLAHTNLRVQPTNVTPFGPAVDAHKQGGNVVSGEPSLAGRMGCMQ